MLDCFLIGYKRTHLSSREREDSVAPATLQSVLLTEERLRYVRLFFDQLEKVLTSRHEKGQTQ